MDDGVEVGEAHPKCLVEATHAGLVRGHVGLRRMVDEAFIEELLENVEISFALHFFGIPADDSLNLPLLIASLRSPGNASRAARDRGAQSPRLTFAR